MGYSICRLPLSCPRRWKDHLELFECCVYVIEHLLNESNTATRSTPAADAKFTLLVRFAVFLLDLGVLFDFGRAGQATGLYGAAGVANLLDDVTFEFAFVCIIGVFSFANLE